MSAPGPVVQGAPAAAPALRMPAALAPGDEVALFSPSSHTGRGREALLPAAVKILEGWGLRVRPLPAEPARHLYLAGTDAHRAEAFAALYRDPALKALFATRGGYGAARMLPYLEAAGVADLLRTAPPKAVVGMSDVAALFAWLHRAGLGTLHGPCIAAPAFDESPAREADLADLHACLFGPTAGRAYPCTVLHPGAGPGAAGPGRGRLVGGNLAVLAAGMGTPWALETAGCVLFLEEINEAPYRVDRTLTQLRQAGRFEGLAALVFGQMVGCDGEPPGLLRQVLSDLFQGAPFPVYEGLPAGHGSPNRTLPLGAVARLEWAAPREGAEAALVVEAG